MCARVLRSSPTTSRGKLWSPVAFLPAALHHAHAPRHTIHATIARLSLSLLPVEVTQREEAFDWILQWLAQQPKSSFASHNYRHACSSSCQCVRRVSCCANTTRALCVRILCVVQFGGPSEPGPNAAISSPTEARGRVQVAASAQVRARLSWCCSAFAVVNEPDVCMPRYLPGQGLHLLWWRGSLIWVTKTRRSQPEHVTNMNGQTQVEPGV